MALHQDKQHDLKIYIVQKVKKGREEKQWKRNQFG